MTNIALIAALAALFAPATPVMAWQDPAPTDQAVNLVLPVVEGARSAPDCGGLYGLAGNAQCMSAPLSRLPAVAELYMTALPQAGWPHVGGGDNQVLFQHRRDDGKCDFLVMLAFYDPELPESALADATGYLGFIMRTEGDCTAPQVEGETPPQ